MNKYYIPKYCNELNYECNSNSKKVVLFNAIMF